MTAIMINSVGVLLIAFIIWWFFVAKSSVKKLTDSVIEIIVEDGVYKPDIIKVRVDKTVKLRFVRRDPTPCAEVVIFNDFNISVTLPLDKPKMLIIEPTQVGEYAFSCQMAMYRGTLIVE